MDEVSTAVCALCPGSQERWKATVPRPKLTSLDKLFWVLARKFWRVAHLSFFERWLPRAYPAWDLWVLRMLARSCISVGTGEDEKEARRCMSPRLPTFAKTKAQRWATRPWCLRKRMVPSIMCVRENGSCWQARSTLGTFGWLRGVDLNHRPLGCLTKPSIMGCISCAAETTRYN